MKLSTLAPCIPPSPVQAALLAGDAETGVCIIDVHERMDAGAVLASRKIPAQLEERRKMIKLGHDLKASSGFEPHLESMLWIWQVRSGMIVLVLGSFHLVLLGLDLLTPLFGERVGIEALTSMERVQAGLWLPYGILLVCVEFHASIGLYRLAVKWGVGQRLSRGVLRIIEHILLWLFLILGIVILLMLAGVLPPPLAFLLAGAGA